MHIDASSILTEDVGASRSFKLTDERPELPDVKLAQPLSGEVRLIRTDFGIAASGRLQTALQLECHRCLSTFSYPVAVNLSAEFADRPDPEQWPITDQQVDLSEPVQQELVLAVPIKQLCRPDCLGLCAVCGQTQDQPHVHADNVIKHRPRIVKGK